VEAAQAALDAADDARQNWMDASRDLIEEREAVPVDVRTRALESARTAELEALARWEVHCVDDPEFEDEGEDGGGTDTGLGEGAGDG
jgi:citrate lyase beta subunit